MDLTSIISIVISFIALLLGIYNWQQSLIRFTIEVKPMQLSHGRWSFACISTNQSTRSASIIRAYIISNNNKIKRIIPTPAEDGTSLFKIGEEVIAKSVSVNFPIMFSSGESKFFPLVFDSELSISNSYVVLEVAKKKFKFKITFPQ